MRLNVPVALFFFNRPEYTQEVFQAIRKAQPSKLFLVSDAPRKGNADDEIKVKACREIVKQIDWPCNWQVNFAQQNMGCGLRIKSGIEWVFENVEEAIVLEDDCLPGGDSFFFFCQQMLERYRNDNRVMVISGTNFLPEVSRYKESYHFSKMLCAWGWATWKRVWTNYDYNMLNWPYVRDHGMLGNVFDEKDIPYWTHIFQLTYEMKINTWDYQLLFHMLLNHGLCVIPRVNLVSNIGLQGTHMVTDESYETNPNSPLKRPTQPMEFPLHHPVMISEYRAFDDALQKIHNPARK